MDRCVLRAQHRLFEEIYGGCEESEGLKSEHKNEVVVVKQNKTLQPLLFY